MAAVKIIGKVAVKVMPDTSDFKKRLKRDLEKIEKSIGDLKVDVVPNVNKTAEKRVKAQMERLQRQLSGKNVNFQPNVSKPHAAVASGILSALTRDRKVSIEPNLDQRAVAGVIAGLGALSGMRVVLDSLHEGFERLQNIDRLVPSIGAFAVKTTLIGAAALATTGHLFSLSQSIASIAGAGLALPGILGGIVVGLGVTTAAFMDFNKVIPELSEKLSDLQNKLSAQFWAEAEQPIRNMIDSLWPAFSAGVLGASTALGTFFGNLATDLSGMNLKPMFDALIESVKVFSGYTDNIASIIEKLGTTGSAYLPALAGWFGDLLAKFDAWLGTGAKLQAMIDTGITNLMALGSVLANTYGILSAIGDAASAAGGASLTSLADGLGRIRETVESAGFQQGLTATFSAAYQAMSNLTNTAGPGVEKMLLAIRDLFIQVAPEIGTAFGNLIGSIGTALANPAVTQGAVAMFDGIKVAMDNLAIAAAPVAEMLAAFGPVVGALAANISALLTTGLDRMAPTFTGIAEAAVPLINQLGGFMQDVLNSLTPLWQTLGDNLQTIIQKLTPLIAAFQDLWNLLAPVLIPVLKIVAQVIGDTVAMAIDGLTNVINGFVKFINGFINLIKAIFVEREWPKVWEAVKEIFSGVFDAIKGIVQIVFSVGVLGLLRKAWSAIKSLFTSSGSTLKTLASELWSSIKSRASTMWDQIQVMPSIAIQAIIKFLKGVVGDVKAAAKLIWDGIKNSLETSLSLVKNLFTSLPGQIKTWLGDLSGTLKGAGEAVIQGLINGIKGMFGSVKGALGDLTGKLKDWKGPYSVDKVLLKPVGALIIEGFLKGLESQYKSVKDSLQGLTHSLADEMGKGADYRLGVQANLDTSNMNLSSVAGLSASVGAAVAAPAAAESGNIRIDNITIPLEDLRQLKDLESFMEMLRVRTRKGAIR